MVMGMGTMRANITQWWKAKKKFSARFREAVAWATISAFLRAVFGSLIDTFGWGPLIAAILLGGVSSVIAWLAEASWYWVLVVGFVIGALILLLAVKAATNLKKQNRLQDKQDLRRLEAQLASPSEPNAVSKALLHSAIGLRKGILRDRLEANRQRVQSQQFQRIVQTVPIRLMQTSTTCRVPPSAGIKVGVGRCLNPARDAKQRAEGVERVKPPVEAERELIEVGL